MKKIKLNIPWANMAVNSSGDHVVINLYGYVGWEVSGIDLINQLNEYPSLKTIHVNINSVGGLIGEGLAIYNTLRKHSAQVTTEIDGYALSMASIIAQAGDVRLMAENALMMIHRAQGGAFGDAKTLAKEAEVLEKHESALISVYEKVMKLPAEDIQAMLDDETWFTAEEALESGLISEISGQVDLDEAENAIQPNVWQMLGTQPYQHAPGNFNKRFENKYRGLKTMPDPIKPIEAKKVQPDKKNIELDAQAIAAQALANDKQRRDDITLVFDTFGGVSGDHSKLMMQCLNDSACNKEKANQLLLTELGKQSPGPIGGHVDVIEDQRDKFIEGAAKAIMARTGLTKAEKNNPYNGMRLTTLAAECVKNAGGSVSGRDEMEIVGAAFAPRYSNIITQSTSDFPIILENVMHKTLLSAYEMVADTWGRFCATGTVSDFRDHNRYKTGSFGALDSVNENGEFRNKNIPDGEREKIAITTKGNLINLTRQMIINDDMGALVTLLQSLGRAGKLSIESDVYALLAANPLMSDGNALFHASHGNLAASGTDITVASLDAARVAMGSQKDISGNEFIINPPDSLLCPLSKGGNARTIVNAVYDPDTANKLQKPNMVNGIVKDIIDTPRISGNAWYLFADRMQNPVLEVAFLNGNQEPFLDLMEMFSVDGAKYKVRLDYGVAAIDWRGAYRNPGA